MNLPIEFGIILGAPTVWSATIMTDNLRTCVEPYLDTFAQSFAAANYKKNTINTYRHLARKLGQLMDGAGIEPSALTPDLADKLALTEVCGPDNRLRFHHFSRRFAEYLIDIKVAQPVPVTEEQAVRAALLADFETYLVKQRGLSPRTIPHVLGFANQFLGHRFGNGILDLTRLCAADTMSFVEHVLMRRTPYRDKTLMSHLRTFFQYLFARGATAANLALGIPRATRRWDARLPRHLSPDGVEAVLASVRGNPRHGARYNFAQICQQIGLRAEQQYGRHGRGPRIHDLRHTFAVRTMIDWYRAGKDPEREMIRLTTYLGHTDPANTFWYLEAVPELLDLAMARATASDKEAIQ
jgi:integrase/recombinase XerD